jgi:hypothetical protein
MLLSPPKSPRKGRQTLAQLRRLQRVAGAVIMRPLNEELESLRTSADGRDMEKVAGAFIKPNRRLSSFERIEIYNRQYWYRLIDAMYDDFPGLRAILGKTRFNRLIAAYLIKYPSRSFTLRNLGRSLPKFLADEPRWAKPHERMALDMARFEWAQVIAFDDPAHPPLTPQDLTGRDPSRLRLFIQPHVTLLEMAYPLDKFSLALKKQGLRSEASNAMGEDERDATQRPVRLPRRKPTFLAVHRVEFDIYFKRLTEPAFRLLSALSAGKTLAQACNLIDGAATPTQIRNWFVNWTGIGWFCRRTHDAN